MRSSSIFVCHDRAVSAKASGRYQAIATLVSRTKRFTTGYDLREGSQGRFSSASVQTCGRESMRDDLDNWNGGAVPFGRRRTFATLLQRFPVSYAPMSNASLP